MVEEVFSIELGASEKLTLKRNRYKGTSEKRISIVSGIHGDELEGQMVCFLLNDFLQKNQEKITGIIDIYPSVNPLGLDSISRNIPFYDTDLNRVFPGFQKRSLPERLANALVESVKGSEIVIDIHSSNIFLKELPQIRINSIYAKKLVPLAQYLNVNFIWVHQPVDSLSSTFTCTMNKLGSKALLIEMGIGLRINKDYCYQIFYGIINLLIKEGFLDYKLDISIKKPLLSPGGKIHFINANQSGIFISETEHGSYVKKGQILGKIVSSLTGKILETVLSPVDGLLFTLREYPVVYEGSLIGRIFSE
ncbi:MAG: succinylglutamate desuccinylase [Aquificae bacterium]|nr:succinylglutamate desuccinylase [Aquificota bacterium]